MIFFYQLILAIITSSLSIVPLGLIGKHWMWGALFVYVVTLFASKPLAGWMSDEQH